jgi:hypothetical protein
MAPVLAAEAVQPGLSVPPPLSRQQFEYYKSHPEEWQQLQSRLPRILAGRAASPPPAPNWQPVTAPAPSSQLSNPVLLTNGTVIIHQYCTGNWYKLTPDINGSYINGTWSAIGSLPAGYGPLYFASQVLNDGRVVINGGEYDVSSGCHPVWTNKGAIYDPNTNVWTAVAPPSGWTTIGDAQSVVLANGKYMLADCCTTNQALFNASTLTWAPTGIGKFDVNDEEGFTLLPDKTVLTTDGYVFSGTCGKNTERYNPTTGTWTSAGNATTQLSDCLGSNPSFELGPVAMRAGGSAVAFSGVGTGAVAGTSIFNTSTHVWSAGPNLPVVASQQYTMADAPSAWLRANKILIAASPGLFSAPTHFFTYGPAPSNTIIQVADTPNAPSLSSFEVNLLVLPTGQILATDFSSDVEIYTATAKAISGVAPIVTSHPTSVNRGSSYTFKGKQLNGLTEGGGYGDDAQSSTNFPLVRIKNNATGHIFYAKTFSFSTRSIAPNVASTAKFRVPATMETGASTAVVIANGVPSAAFALTVL